MILKYNQHIHLQHQPRNAYYKMTNTNSQSTNQSGIRTGGHKGEDAPKVNTGENSTGNNGPNSGLDNKHQTQLKDTEMNPDKMMPNREGNSMS